MALRLVSVVEEREHAIVLIVGDRIELVGVALRTLKREPEHRLADAVHAIEDALHAKLFIENRSFAVGHAVA